MKKMMVVICSISEHTG